MEPWYLPITIIPGLGMLILSTITLTLDLSSEINDLISGRCTAFQYQISRRKIKQLGLLTRAGVLLYLATGSYVLSGIFGALFNQESYYNFTSLILYVGTVFILIALSFLIIYAFRAVKIRKDQFSNVHIESH